MIFVFGIIFASNTHIMFEASEETEEFYVPIKGSIYMCSAGQSYLWDKTKWRREDRVTGNIYKSQFSVLDCTEKHERLHFGFNGV